MKSFLAVILFALYLPMAAQAPSFDEMEFESDSVTTSYKSAGKNYVFIRSKRGSSGVNKTAAADAILSAEVTEIVLVFSEIDPSAITEREEANRERWENLLKTYPELFQFSTTYKNLCQCSSRGDSAAFKKSQGFYVYVNGDVPKVAAEEPKTAAASPPPPAETPKPAKTEEKKKAADIPPAVVMEEKKDKKVAAPDRTEVKLKEPPVAAIEKAEKKEAPAVAAKEEAPAEEEAKEPVRKKSASVSSSKPRRAKDPKACRPACYGYGDEDLNAFFKENIPLTKKQRKKAKSWSAMVRIQIHFDGSIKKAMVTGTNEEFNKQVQEVLKMMNNWNSAVKSGVAVKSEVRFTLKYDGDSKAMKPSDMVLNPRPTPKCTCVSDSEMFD